MLQQLTLTHFRHMAAQRYGDLGAVNLLLGENGAGKTNILEAISLLSPGKGLRGATPAQWRQHDAPATAPWAVNALLMDAYDGQSVATGSPPSDPLSTKRIVMIDHQVQSSQQTLADVLAVVWLTPQMDGLFLSDTQERRRFFDRLIYALYPDHAKYLAIYENGLRQRNKLLKQQQRDLFWYRALHQTMAAPAAAIAAARNDMIAQLNHWVEQTNLQMPLPRLSVNGYAEDLLHTTSSAQVEQSLRDRWEQDLQSDLQHGSTQTGPHRSDFAALYITKNMPAQFCSTGEQKALLLSVILSHAHGVKQHNPQRPLIILLDDIAAHFDETRRQYLYDYIPHLPAQIWLSGTDCNDFDGLQNARILEP